MNLAEPVTVTSPESVVLVALAILGNMYSVDWEWGIRQYGESALEKRQNASKFEEAEKITANKTSILGRPFPLRDKNKVSNT